MHFILGASVLLRIIQGKEGEPIIFKNIMWGGVVLKGEDISSTSCKVYCAPNEKKKNDVRLLQAARP